MRALFAAVCLLAAACTSDQTSLGGCSENGECPIGATCRRNVATGSGVCVCRSSEACDPGEICNSQGVCQKEAGCRTNVDCKETGKFCDAASGACIERTACGMDVHCLPGSVCENDRCLDGCHTTADCPLYTVCENGGPTVIGQCVPGMCDDNSFCDFGSSCISRACSVDPNPNHCSLDCANNAACGNAGRNFCLVNPAYDPNNPRSNYESYCGVECAGQEECPNGYNCSGVVLLTQDQCMSDPECGGGGRRCAIGEGDLRGFCTCVSDQDCALDDAPPACVGSCGGLGVTQCTTDDQCLVTNCEFTCQNPAGQPCTDSSQCQPLPLCQGGNCVTGVGGCSTGSDCLCIGGTCLFTGRPCASSADCKLPCVNNGCLLGAACGPEEGLLCTDLR